MEYKDMMGRSIRLAQKPQRIISIVPSQTELLFDLGLEQSVVGITKFCVHPESWFRSKQRVGGTKTLDLEKIRELKPDLIIANKEENTKEQIEELEKEFPVWISDINNLDQALLMITMLGELLGKIDESETLVEGITKQLKLQKIPAKKEKVIYLIWEKPYMSAGENTFIHDLLCRAGWNNIGIKKDSRYPEWSVEELAKLKPEKIFLSSEPFPFKAKQIEELKLICPAAKVELVDGEAFSWYGSRLLKGLEYIGKLTK